MRTMSEEMLWRNFIRQQWILLLLGSLGLFIISLSCRTLPFTVHHHDNDEDEARKTKSYYRVCCTYFLPLSFQLTSSLKLNSQPSLLVSNWKHHYLIMTIILLFASTSGAEHPWISGPSCTLVLLVGRTGKYYERFAMLLKLKLSLEMLFRQSEMCCVRTCVNTAGY